jgi:hypothetical protein
MPDKVWGQERGSPIHNFSTFPPQPIFFRARSTHFTYSEILLHDLESFEILKSLPRTLQHLPPFIKCRLRLCVATAERYHSIQSLIIVAKMSFL